MNLPDVTIRQATHKDIDGLVDLLKELFSIEEDFSFNPQKQQRGLTLMLEDDRACVIIACMGEKVIGMCSAQMLLSTAEGGPVGLVEDLVVSEPYRGHGIGERLLQAIENQEVKNGATRLQLLADKNNTPALHFYDKKKWQRTQLVCLRKKFL